MSRHHCLLFLLLLSVAAAAVTRAAREGTTGVEVLSTRLALALAIRNNLDLRVDEIAVPIGRDEVVAAEAGFDPAVDADVDAQARRTPLGVAAGDDVERIRTEGAGLGISKRFTSGLLTRLGLETRRASGDLGGDLDPEYRSFLVLDLSQPLLRGRGAEVNTADLRVSENRVRQASYGALAQAQRVAEEVETTYLDLALAQEVLELRHRSRSLAGELAAGNREKLEVGAVPITEVQQAETAVASRDEQILAARQNVEVAQALLLDLLNVSTGHPLYGAEVRAEPLPAIAAPHPGRSEALELALEKRPDLQSQQIEVANRNIRLAFFDNQTLPRLDLAATLGLNGLSGNGRGSNDGPIGESLSDTAAGEGYEWFAGLRFTYPLGNRAAVARRRQAGDRKSQEIHRLKRLERAVETEVQTALVTVERSLERYRVAERFVSLARLTLEQEQARLREGLSDTFRILDFQDDLIEAEVRRATALADYHKGLARLFRAVGTNLERYGIIYDVDAKEIPHV